MARKYYKGYLCNDLVFLHLYQRTQDRRALFKNTEDHIVFYTICNVLARKFSAVILAQCHMYNHFHILCQLPDQKLMGKFMGQITSLFTKKYNIAHQRTGQLFKRPFGNSVKEEPLKICSTIAYVFNNPVKAKICKKAIQYKWNFLQLLESKHKKKQKIKLRELPLFVREEVSLIDSMYDNLKCIDYDYLNSLKSRVVARVRQMKRVRKATSVVSDNQEQWLDELQNESIIHDVANEYIDLLHEYILNKYCSVDIPRLSSFYKDFDTMLLAIDSNMGSDYDLKEDN